MANKLSHFQSFVYSSKISVIAVCETWLSDSIFDREILPNGYSIFRGSRGGRVLIASDSHLSACLLPSPPVLESLSLRLILPSPISHCVVYCPHSSDEAYWLSLLTHVRSLFSSSDPVYIVGDFNCPDIDWPTFSASSRISSLLCDLNFDLHLTQYY